MESVQVSVVVTAHDRKKYLKGAIKSLLRQSVDRNNFEIIVVKNYRDREIDDFLSSNNIVNVFTDSKSFGAKLSEGIKNSSGEIIAFLDDDDEFAPQKIERIIEEFRENKSLNYFHNGIIQVGESGAEIEEPKNSRKDIDKFLIRTPPENLAELHVLSRLRGDWYMSCIAVRKKMAAEFIDFVNSTSFSLDRVFFILSAAMAGNILLSSEALTKYRLHESITGIKSTFHEYCQKKLKFFENTFNVLLQLEMSIGKNNTLMQYIKIQETHNMENILLYDSHGKRIRRAKVAIKLYQSYFNIKDRLFLILSILMIFSFLSPRVTSYLHYLYQIKKISSL